MFSFVCDAAPIFCPDSERVTGCLCALHYEDRVILILRLKSLGRRALSGSPREPPRHRLAVDARRQTEPTAQQANSTEDHDQTATRLRGPWGADPLAGATPSTVFTSPRLWPLPRFRLCIRLAYSVTAIKAPVRGARLDTRAPACSLVGEPERGRTYRKRWPKTLEGATPHVTDKGGCVGDEGYSFLY